MPAEVTEKKKQPTMQKWKWTRWSVQVLFLLVFLYLLLGVTQGVAGRLPSDLFFHLDPLTAITSMLAGRTWIAPMALAIITLVLTIFFGRAWCGWLCPMGTILDLTPSRKSGKNPGISPRWSQVKYFLLFAVIFGAVLGSLTLIVFDPITLLFRTISGAVLPGLNWAIGGAESWLYGFEGLRPAVDWVDKALSGWLLNSQPFYLPNVALLAVLAAVLGLNAVRSRFWCRYLCPLGGLLGLISKISFIRHKVNAGKCISCRKCSTLCPTGAISPENHFTADVAECTYCLKCMENCPTMAISFARPDKKIPLQDTSRRRFLVSASAALIAAVFLRFIPPNAKKAQSAIRPPGSTEESLYDRCIRCGECVKVCPTGVIQPGQAGNPEKIWTPSLATRLGYCDYSCNSCGKICPTGAISSLNIEEKRLAVIGIAKIDQTRCITWAEGRDCIVCEEMCPVPVKAIKLGGGGQGHGSGGARHPQVIDDLCIGCGICEHQCPVVGEAAIRVYPVIKI
jgi:MauM/NapG family ferredoxin protein